MLKQDGTACTSAGWSGMGARTCIVQKSSWCPAAGAQGWWDQRRHRARICWGCRNPRPSSWSPQPLGSAEDGGELGWCGWYQW